jgi:hypothetical protein
MIQVKTKNGIYRFKKLKTAQRFYESLRHDKKELINNSYR